MRFLQAGFSLLELLFSLLLCSLLFLLLFQFYPVLYQSLQTLKLEHQLRLEGEGMLDKMTKDLYRVGFVAQDKALILEPFLTISEGCLIILYDLERNGKLALSTEDSHSDRFAYRLNKNNLEYKRGAKSCAGSNWFKLNDPDRYQVTEFKITRRSFSYHIYLALQTKQKPTRSHVFSHFIRIYDQDVK